MQLVLWGCPEIRFHNVHPVIANNEGWIGREMLIPGGRLLCGQLLWSPGYYILNASCHPVQCTVYNVHCVHAKCALYNVICR